MEMRAANFWRDCLAQAAKAARTREIRLMEVCGTHTHAIAEYGLRKLLPDNVKLISGPGCPVCVSGAGFIEKIRFLSRQGVTVALFGDLLRIPGAAGTLRGEAKLRIVYSPDDALDYAAAYPDTEMVFAAVGFEPTLSAGAALLARMEELDLPNFTLLSDFKRLRPVLDELSASRGLDGFVLPGHVASIVGETGFSGLDTPGVIAGFAPEAILHSIKLLLDAIARGDRHYRYNNYPEAVRRDGNPAARALIDHYFEPGISVWRGLGPIAGAGWKLRGPFARFDAARRYELPETAFPETPGCRCGEVLTGAIAPEGCALFGNACTPDDPAGACMSSLEGACAAAWNFREAV